MTRKWNIDNFIKFQLMDDNMDNKNEVLEKVRYSDEELQEFKEIILKKLEKARDDYEQTFKVLEEGASALSKEESGQLAQRQLKFIHSLEAALVRIENKTYGICRETGKLIPKERLKLVPHATLSIEAKLNSKKK